MSLDKIITHILATEESKLGELQEELSNKSEDLAKMRDKVEGALALLDVSKHTLGFIHLMCAVYSGEKPKFDKLLFIKNAQAVIMKGVIKQIHADPKRFSYICRRFVELCRDAGFPMRAIKPLRLAMKKIAQPEYLTPQHSLFTLACISAKCYRTALPVLDTFSYLVDPHITGLKCDDILLYFYYGGYCYVAMKEWEKAIEFFETVISIPAVTPSAIMVEAYKKLILVSLIFKGESPTLPKSANSSVIRFIKSLKMITTYEELANSFATNSIDDISRCIEANTEQFAKDLNLGLVGQVRSSLVQHSIKNVTKTYSTIKYSNLMEYIGVKEDREAERLLLRMIESKFPAKIHQQHSYVTFETSEWSYNNDDTVQYFNNHIHAAVGIHKQIAYLDRLIEKSDKLPLKYGKTRKYSRTT